MPVKRLNYFTHQLLREQDFKEEQAYHLGNHRRHNRTMHSPGVVEGLTVEAAGREITVTPGLALDREGREIALEEPVTRDMSSFSAGSDAYITLAYHEQLDDADHVSAGGVEGYTRVTETPVIGEQRREHIDDDAVVLARVHIGQGGRVQDVDMSRDVRRNAREETAPRGWLRLPFKPVRLNPVRFDTTLAEDDSSEFDFTIDEANAYCGRHGARGSMQIPVPPGVSHVTGFRVAGTTRGELIARLFRTGWNLAEGKGEKTRLVEETFTQGAFHKEIEIEPPQTTLGELNALSVSIRADGESEIWLVAVKVH